MTALYSSHSYGTFTLYGNGTGGGTGNGINWFYYVLRKYSHQSETGTRAHWFLFCQSRFLKSTAFSNLDNWQIKALSHNATAPATAINESNRLHSSP